VNPFVAFYESPVAAATAFAYVCILFAALVASWWAASRNALYLYDRWQAGWLVLVPGEYTLRAIAMLLLLALDALLIGGIIHVLTA